MRLLSSSSKLPLQSEAKVEPDWQKKNAQQLIGIYEDWMKPT